MGNEVYRSVDGGRTWTKTHGDEVDVAGSKAPYSFNQIKTNPADPAQIIVNSDSMYESRDGGKTWNCQFFRSVFGDFRTMWWDEQDPQRIMLGSDGGVSVSYDGGRTADYFLNMRIGEVYAVGIDMDDPYNVYAGLQDHDSWKGPSNSRNGQITLEDWKTVGTGDGMYNQVDPTDSRWVYNSFQTGGQRRFDQRTGQSTNIQPQRPQGGPRAALQLGHAASCCRRTIRRWSTRAHRCCSAPTTAETRGRRSVPISPRAIRPVRPEPGLRALLHDYLDLGVAAHSRASSGWGLTMARCTSRAIMERPGRT